MKNRGIGKLNPKCVKAGRVNKYVSIINTFGHFYIIFPGYTIKIAPRYFLLDVPPSHLPNSKSFDSEVSPRLTYRYFLTESGYLCVDDGGCYQTNIRFINGWIKSVKHESLLLVEDNKVYSANLQCLHHTVISSPVKINEYYIVCVVGDCIYYYKLFDKRVVIQKNRRWVALEGFIAMSILNDGSIIFDDLNAVVEEQSIITCFS